MDRTPIGIWLSGMVLAVGLCPASADDSPALKAPRTRAELRHAVENQKQATPYLSLPPGAPVRGNNGGMQRYYLPKEWSLNQRLQNAPVGKRGEGEAGQPKSAGPGERRGNDFTFNTKLFWIVSRANDCRYCLGHQEAKLAGAGLPESSIAMLDGDWATFDDKSKSAFKFAKKVTLEPHRIGDADIVDLLRYHGEKEVLAIINSCAGFNRTNRWTGGLNIPQDQEPMGRKQPLDAEIDPSLAHFESKMMPSSAVARPPLESKEQVLAMLAGPARNRKPRLPLLTQESFADFRENPLPIWVRGAAATADAAIVSYRNREAIFSTGKISTILKRRIAWSTARENRAWYALSDAKRQLEKLGESEVAIFALDNPTTKTFDQATSRALQLARKLTVQPQLMQAADFGELKQHFNDFEIAEIVWVTATSNYFDRLTESLGLSVE